MTDVRSATALVPELEPVRRTLLEDAHATAEQILSAARDDAVHVVARAQTESDEAVERARRRAAQSALAQSQEAVAAARRAAHRSVLRAQAELREAAALRVYASVEQIGSDPRYPALLDHLERLARERLGPEIVVTRDPQPGGGVVAHAGARTVDYRLRALADLALEAVAERLDFEEEPWH